MKMPFGKHKGEEVHSLPESYLSWLQAAVKLREPLKSAVEQALKPADEKRLAELLSQQKFC